MIYDVPALTMLAKACAPEIATEAVLPLIVTESGGDPLQINVNRGPRIRARTLADGVSLVRRYVAAGYTVDVGLAQINSANFARLGATLEQAFEPCTNLRLASTVLRWGYGVASQRFSGLDAISATYSLYNTGTMTRGLRNGYVSRVWSMAAALGSIAAPPPLPVATPGAAATTVAATPEQRDDWVFGQLASNAVEVFK